MGSYIVSPPKETPWQMDLQAFAVELRQHWAEIVLRTSTTAGHTAIEWTLPMEHGPLEGGIDRSGQAVYMDGDIRDCAQFAVWVRTLVPLQQGLIFYDEGYSADVNIEAESSVNDLVKPFIA